MFNKLQIYFIVVLFIPIISSYADASENWQLGFQDPATPIMEGIINLHHDLMFFICIISIFVTWMLSRTI